MIPGLGNAAMPGMDMFGLSQMFQQAAQNPQAMIPHLAAAGIEPPTGAVPDPMSPFAGVENMPTSGATDFSSQSVKDPGMMTPDGRLAPPQTRSIAPPMNQPPMPAMSPGMTPDGRLPGTPQVPAVQPPMPPQDPAAGVFGMIPGGAPVPSGVPQAPSGWPDMSMVPPSLMPSGGGGMPAAPAQGNPFPTPIGSAPSTGAAQPAAAGKANNLADMLRGMKAPAAPEAQKVSTPSAPQPRAIDQNSALVALITKLMSGQQAGGALDPLRLGPALGGK